ncbi:zinc-ribbon domain-containing protein [Cytobacillus firmus]|uniref:zinc ribbon domain-containing protein n=1 Tax=Cytobacillus firmus TaxID=1399 RepID=UPI00207AFCD7|nr:zinc-ribbon domain-containing protein [Cytobacillus firmus]USK38720.1 zinc-ribbon domain-containing protein [Cytobacillus firmus]
MKYCKECGKQLKEGAQFCGECGTSYSSNQKQDSSTRVTNSVKSKPMDIKTKRIIAAAGVALIILFGGYKAGEALTSQNRLIEKFENALLEKDEKAISKLLTSNDKKLEISEKSVKGFVAYIEKNPDLIGEIIQGLESQAKLMEQQNNSNKNEQTMAEEFFPDNMVNLEKDGKILFYDKFEINIPSVYLNLSTNYKDTELFVDGKKVGKSSNADFEKTFGPYLPGIYKIEAKLKTDFVELTTEEEVLLSGFDNKESIGLYLEGEDVTVYFDGDDTTSLKGKLFINGEDVGVNPFQESTFGPVLTDGSMNLEVEAELPWGKIKTAKIPIDTNEIQINLANNENFQKTLMDTVVSGAKERLEAYTSGDIEKYSAASPSEKDSLQVKVDEAKEYDISFKGKYLGSAFDLNSFSVYSEEGKWKAQLSVNEKYQSDEYYAGESPDMQNSEEYLDYTLVFDDKAEKWLVDGRYSAWSFNDEHIKEFKEKKPKEYVTTWGNSTAASATASSNEGTSEEVTKLMDNYLNQLVSAINSNQFDSVSPYLAADSQLYKDQKALVERLGEKGTTEELLDYQVSNYSQEGSETIIYTWEKIKINYADGTSETKEYNWKYTAVYNADNELVLTNLEAE